MSTLPHNLTDSERKDVASLMRFHNCSRDVAVLQIGLERNKPKVRVPNMEQLDRLIKKKVNA